MPDESPLKLGLLGIFNGERYFITGRVKYSMTADGDYYFWNEWLLLSEKGQYKWLSESGSDYTLEETFTPTTPVDPSQLRSGLEINLDGKMVRINEISKATIEMFEGELTWNPKTGEQIYYADAFGFPDDFYSIMWGEEEITFYKGKRIPPQEIAKAFSLPADLFTSVSPAAQTYTHEDTVYTTPAYEYEVKEGGSLFGGPVVEAVLTFVIIAFVVLACLVPMDGCGGSTYSDVGSGYTTRGTGLSYVVGGVYYVHYSGGTYRSSRSSSSTYRGSTTRGGSYRGGTFRGGK